MAFTPHDVRWAKRFHIDLDDEHSIITESQDEENDPADPPAVEPLPDSEIRSALRWQLVFNIIVLVTVALLAGLINKEK